MTRQGLPTVTQFLEIFLVTALPVLMTEPLPVDTPGMTETSRLDCIRNTTLYFSS